MSQSARLHLPTVTLCCVDSTARLHWALKALRHCVQQIDFADVVLCTDRIHLGDHPLPRGARWVEIEPLTSIEAYSHFMLKSLAPLIRTEHVLIVQWDGYVLDPAGWRDEFLGYDYVGAPWPHIAEPNKVGNGGFSLRSRRLLLALEDPAFAPGDPEDVCICVTHRAALQARGLRFAPTSLAAEFSVEEGADLRSGLFGFHGAYHLPSILPPDEVLAFIESLETRAVLVHSFGNLMRNLTRLARRDARLQPAYAAMEDLIRRAVVELRGPPSLTPKALWLCKALIRYGQHQAAGQLLRQRRAALGQPFAEPALRVRLQMQRLRVAVKSLFSPSHATQGAASSSRR
jgi:hypothetical protein